MIQNECAFEASHIVGAKEPTVVFSIIERGIFVDAFALDPENAITIGTMLIKAAHAARRETK
jgi:hypothetical protein